jgi:hypothetical protein
MAEYSNRRLLAVISLAIVESALVLTPLLPLWFRLPFSVRESNTSLYSDDEVQLWPKRGPFLLDVIPQGPPVPRWEVFEALHINEKRLREPRHTEPVETDAGWATSQCTLTWQVSPSFDLKMPAEDILEKGRDPFDPNRLIYEVRLIKRQTQ